MAPHPSTPPSRTPHGSGTRLRSDDTLTHKYTTCFMLLLVFTPPFEPSVPQSSINTSCLRALGTVCSHAHIFYSFWLSQTQTHLPHQSIVLCIPTKTEAVFDASYIWSPLFRLYLFSQKVGVQPTIKWGKDWERNKGKDEQTVYVHCPEC